MPIKTPAAAPCITLLPLSLKIEAVHAPTKAQTDAGLIAESKIMTTLYDEGVARVKVPENILNAMKVRITSGIKAGSNNAMVDTERCRPAFIVPTAPAAGIAIATAKTDGTNDKMAEFMRCRENANERNSSRKLSSPTAGLPKIPWTGEKSRVDITKVYIAGIPPSTKNMSSPIASIAVDIGVSGFFCIHFPPYSILQRG